MFLCLEKEGEEKIIKLVRVKLRSIRDTKLRNRGKGEALQVKFTMREGETEAIKIEGKSFKALILHLLYPRLLFSRKSLRLSWLSLCNLSRTLNSLFF